VPWNIALHPNLDILISGHDNGHLVIWDLNSGIMLKNVLIKNAKAVLSVAISNSGTFVAIGKDDSNA